VEIIITQWALDAYLDLKHESAFSQKDFEETIRPDVMLLKDFPDHPKFSNGKFFSPATLDNEVLAQGFKMKWHNLGQRNVQLRLGIGLGLEDYDCAFLLHAYVKTDAKFEERQLVKLKTRLDLVRKGRFIERGRLK
jgi:hypothetical protein